MRSVVDWPTEIVIELWAGANAAIVDPAGAVRRRAVTASNGAKNEFGNSTSALVVAVMTRFSPPTRTWLVAVSPLSVV